MSAAKEQGRYSWIIVGIASLLSALACAAYKPMGELPSDGTPVEFTAEGETEHTWTAHVVPGDEYVVSLSSDEYSFVQGNMDVYDEGLNSSEAIGHLATRESAVSSPPDVTFTAPEDGEVSIIILVYGGIDYEPFGEYIVTLRHK
ncbi:MAG: hypothetical protein JXJ17_12070 [Anaerolineae bacterium]|nr:hypothetical protein [Anaerolineae bacterium]